MNWLLYTSIVGIIFFINTIVIMVEAVFPLQSRSIVLESFILADFVTLLFVFTVVGSILIIKLEAYFGKNYNMQWKCLVTVLCLHAFILVLIIVRQSLELTNIVDGITTQSIVIAVLDNDVLSMTTQTMFWFLAFAEYLPFIVLLFTMWLSSRC